MTQQGSEIEDAALIARAKAGERQAFGLLIARHRPRVLRQMQAWLGSEETARDIVQEATLQTLLALPALRDETRFAAWFAGIARNVCRQEFRQRTETLRLEEDSCAMPDTAEVFLLRSERERLREAVARLPDVCREATHLFYFEQWSIAEIAESLDVSAGAIRVRLHDARIRLRALLASEPQSLRNTERKSGMVPVRFVPMTEYGSDLLPNVAAQVEAPFASEENARMFLLACLQGLFPNFPSGIFLWDEVGKRALRVSIGQAWVGSLLESGSPKDKRQPRPYELMGDILQSLGASVTSVRMDRLEDGPTFGEVLLHSAQSPRPIRTKPVDALILAAYTKAPVRVPEVVLARDGWMFSEPQPMVERLLSGDLAAAIQEPFLIRMAEEYLKNRIGNLAYHRANREDIFDNEEHNELLLKPHYRAPHPVVFWHRQWENDSTHPVEIPTPLPIPLLPVLCAYFKQRAGLDLAVNDTEQSGAFVVVRDRQADVQVRVTAHLTEHGGSLTLSLRETDRFP